MNAVIKALTFIIQLFINLPDDPIGSFLAEHSADFALFQQRLDIINYFVPLNIMFPAGITTVCLLSGPSKPPRRS